MTPFQALFLGILQGLTEFLPVSSSGHLVIVPWLLGWDQASLTFDTMVHWGTLLAVVIYFRQDILLYIRAAWKSLRQRSLDVPHARVAWAIAVGSIPAALAGLLLQDTFEALFHAPRKAAGFLLVTALLLVVSELIGRRSRPLEDVGLVDGLLIGVGQALAITPGISRSGSTIATALTRGLRREAATRFSFLLGLPIIFGAGLVQIKDVVAGSTPEPTGVLMVGFFAAAISGYAAIHYLLQFVRHHSLYVFAVYCALVGGGVLLLT